MPDPDEEAIVVVPTEVLDRPASARPFGAEDVLERFLRRRSRNTLQAYKKDLESLCAWRGWDERQFAREVLASRAQANALALDWLHHMQSANPPLASATQARRLSALRSFVAMAGQLGVVEWALTVEGPKIEPYRDTRGPGTERAQQLIEACGSGLKGLRDYAMLLLMLTLGLRRFELAELSTERLDVPGGRALVKGKGGKWVWVPAPRETLDAVATWLAAWREAHGDPADDRIFRALGGRCIGRPLTPKAVWDIVSALGKKVGIDVWPHGIRHTAVTTFLDLTQGDVRAARVFARHSNVQTTMKYDDNRQDQARAGAEGLAKLFVRKEDK